jgi:hypothetical protein
MTINGKLLLILWRMNLNLMQMSIEIKIFGLSLAARETDVGF